jgi:hypothetical protein
MNSIILGLVLAIFTQLFDLQMRTSAIEDRNAERISNTLNSLNGVEAKYFDEAQAMWRYLAKRVREAQKSIDDMTISASYQQIPPAVGQAREEYRKTERSIQSKKNVRWREVLAFPHYIDKAEMKLKNGLANYHPRYYEFDPRDPPFQLIQFMILDAEEVVFSSYGNPEDTQTWLAVRHPEIVRLFQKYYEAIWSKAKPLREGNETGIDALSHIKKRLVENEEGLA